MTIIAIAADCGPHWPDEALLRPSHAHDLESHGAQP